METMYLLYYNPNQVVASSGYSHDLSFEISVEV